MTIKINVPELKNISNVGTSKVLKV